MKAFRFRFQKVLQVRETREKSSRNRFAYALQAWRAEKAALEAARESYRQAISSLVLACRGEPLASAGAPADVSRELPTPDPSPWREPGRIHLASQVLLLEPGLSASDRQVQRQSARTEEAARQVSHRREDLILATRSRKAVEHLRDQRKAEHQYREAWEEQKGLDEVAVKMFTRSSHP